MNTLSQPNNSPRTAMLQSAGAERPVFETTDFGDLFPSADGDGTEFFDPDPISGGTDPSNSYEDIAGQAPFLDLELS